MQTFIEYLTEGRLAPLYHGTTYGVALKIFRENALLATTPQYKYKLLLDKKPPEGAKAEEITGISLTRSKGFAEHWSGNMVLQFDQRKLTHNYRIIPLQYWTTDGGARYKEPFKYHNKKSVANEYEEFVLTGRSLKALDYLTAVHVGYDLYDEFMKTPEAELLQKRNIEIKRLKP